MNATPDLHIVIATGQNQANLIPALQCKANEVWILETPAMKNARSAAHLADALKSQGIKVERIDFDDGDVTALHRQAEAIARRVNRRPVTINISGGTKLMTLALVQTLAQDLDTTPGGVLTHIVYCDSRHSRLEWIAPVPRVEAMEAVLRINDILLVQGFRQLSGTGGADTAEWQRNAQDRADLTRWIGDRAQNVGRFLGTLNALAQKALPTGSRRFEPRQHLDYPPSRAPAELLQKAREASLISWCDGGTEVVFRSDSAAVYLGGGWVEEYAGLKLSGIKPNGGWSPRLKIEQVDTRSQNELDGVVVHNNRMMLIECKAARPGQDATDWIYKLAQLARAVGGLMAQPMLLSARELSDEDRARAREYGVQVLAGVQLHIFADTLRSWMNGR